ncbi:MBL fold metallo-hydrolase [bacterium]|nr:MBL fold metallo-hydrolase [bacterium]
MIRIYLIGAGTPTPTRSRFGTSYILQVNKDYLMFDCGPAATHKLVKTGLFPTQIDYLFFTHHHFDHNADYPCFVLCRWDQSTGKENQLNVYGPSPTESMTEKLFDYNGVFAIDINARINGPVSQKVHQNRGGSLPRSGLKMNVKDISAGEIIEGKNWKIVTARAHHLEPYLESIAYRVETQDGTIVFLGDTGHCNTVTDLCRGADVLVANCWDHQMAMEENGEAPGQTGTIDAAKMAKDSGAKTLVLTHLGARISAAGSIEKAIGDISQIFSGKIIVSREKMCIDVF